MKLRISGNSIRLRLSMSDVQMLVQNGIVLDKTHIGNGILRYQITQKMHENELSATFENDTINVHIPKDWLTNWDNDERVGFEGCDANGLNILIEKDFQCMKPRQHEDESDLYLNPNSAHG
ncbi:MAG TPA: hypothetical protein PKD51_01140 [Saprospiraceae bacterium]|nr:hypothetical protein [Saprospiraceae bacterium]HMU02539.1 hypothetical protein [Saprospiraceae bacterium]